MVIYLPLHAATTMGNSPHENIEKFTQIPQFNLSQPRFELSILASELDDTDRQRNSVTQTHKCHKTPFLDKFKTHQDKRIYDPHS